MGAVEITILASLLVAAALGAIVFLAVIRHTHRSGTVEAVSEGRFAAALESAETGPSAPRDELYAAAVAAKHRLRFAEAGSHLDRILEADPTDGEAWLERGLVLAYQDDPEGAEAAFRRAERRRSDLLESLVLHRAWLELRRGRGRPARRRFEEVEVSVQTKLEEDLGAADPVFAEWFLQAADLWALAGDARLARWAREEAAREAGDSLLVARWGELFPVAVE